MTFTALGERIESMRRGLFDYIDTESSLKLSQQSKENVKQRLNQEIFRLSLAIAELELSMFHPSASTQKRLVGGTGHNHANQNL